MGVFGREIDGNQDRATIGRIAGSYFTCPADCNADKITARISYASPIVKTKCAIYLKSDLSFVGSTEEVNLPEDFSGLQDYNFSAPKPSLSTGVDYVLVIWSETGVAAFTMRSQGIGFTDHSCREEVTYNGWPANLAGLPGDYEFCINCTYSIVSNAYPVAWLKKNLVSGFHVFLNQYIRSKILGYDPLKLPDGTIF